MYEVDGSICDLISMKLVSVSCNLMIVDDAILYDQMAGISCNFGSIGNTDNTFHSFLALWA